MLYKKNWGEKNMHSIRTDFGFNLLHSASKLKRGVIEKKWWVLLVFRIFLPPIFLLFFFLPWIVMRTLFVNHFQSILFNILYDIRLSSTFLWTFFSNVIFCVCSLLFFFSQPDVNITWISGHIHRSIVDKIDPTSEYLEMAKTKYLINYIGLHIFVKCDQKNLFIFDQ